MKYYPIEWIKVERFCELTGYTEEAVKQKRKKGDWRDGDITAVRGRRLHVNVRRYDQWVEAQNRSVAA